MLIPYSLRILGVYICGTAFFPVLCKMVFTEDWRKAVPLFLALAAMEATIVWLMFLTESPRPV